MLVELKNGETLNGHLVSCDTYMNLTLKEVVQTNPDGDRFFRLQECYVRGNNVSSIPAVHLNTIPLSSPLSLTYQSAYQWANVMKSDRSSTFVSPMTWSRL